MNQHHQPCHDCAFRRDGTPGNLGGSPVETYIGQTEAGFWLPCHGTYEPGVPAKQQDPAKAPQCAGAAIYRANLGITAGGRLILRDPQDKAAVFASHAEFIAHHLPVPLPVAEELVACLPPALFAELELRKARVHLVPRTVTSKEKVTA